MKSLNYFLVAAMILAAPGVFCSAALAQEHKGFLLQRNMTTGKDSVVRAFETPSVRYDTVKARKNWGKLRKDLTEKEVANLLGRPARHRFDPENALDYWSYGRKAVVFNTIYKKVWIWDK